VWQFPSDSKVSGKKGESNIGSFGPDTTNAMRKLFDRSEAIAIAVAVLSHCRCRSWFRPRPAPGKASMGVVVVMMVVRICVVLCCVRFGSFQRYLTVRTFDRGHRIALAISAALPQPTVYRVFLKYSHLPTSCTAPRLPFHFRRSLKPNHEEDFCWRFGFGCFRFGGRFDERDFRFE
jgi:hypothetical protein